MVTEKLVQMSASLISLLPVVTLIVGFAAGFFTRMYFFKKNSHNSLVNNLISDIEYALSVIFEDAVFFTEKYHDNLIDIAPAYITIRQQLMVSRLKHVKKLIDRLSNLEAPPQKIENIWTEFRVVSDRVFDQPNDTTNLAHLAHAIEQLSLVFQKIK